MNDQERVPKINNPKVFGVRPDSEFILPITASGEKPFHYSALNLPKDLSINESNGTITGKITNKGRYEITLQVKNKYGKAERDIEVVVGENISLTPPMGWNHWNCWGPKIDEDKVRQAADSIIANSLKDHGWVYVNIDDGWQGQRDPKTKALQPNEKFKDMKALCDYVHSLGLKIGIYSTPWRKSYAGFAGGSADTEDGKILGDDDGHTIGKYHFEEQDAKQWAEWGIDYLKYDWNPIDLDSTKRMYKALRNSGRDIILSLSNSTP
ncbi:MAG: putative Ig domain-containing protein [Candidatus Micrarchaeaceae archaeon]